MLTPEEKKKLTTELNQFDNIEDMLIYLNTRYDLKKAKLGIVTKPMFVNGILKAIEAAKPPKRNWHLAE